ncbi:AIM21 [Candida jiufengensis]|uniref:AIM21 n=1 Tax=Candida jiufengensis TaxID=497108 RepID=UPI002223FF0C|nr:AIM21 [Candida jiufengensis]KAI5951259.1 AIM21 [Candida jiufengensis]
MNSGESGSSTPKIPPRPRKQKTSDSLKLNESSSTMNSLNSKSEDDIEKISLNSSELPKANFDNYDTSSGEKVTTEDDKTGEIIKEAEQDDEEGILNSQLNEDDPVDGEKTPGNSTTKATFKEDVEDQEGLDERSSFDDDLETIMQENQSINHENLNQDSSRSETLDEEIKESSEINDVEEIDKSKGITNEDKQIPDKALESKSMNTRTEEKDTSDIQKQFPTIPSRPISKEKSNSVKKTDELDKTIGINTSSVRNEIDQKEIDKSEDKVLGAKNEEPKSSDIEPKIKTTKNPIIPNRPKRKDISENSLPPPDEVKDESSKNPKESTESISDINSASKSSSNLSTNQPADKTPDSKNDQNNEKSSSKDSSQSSLSSTPQIPSRPKKEEVLKEKPRAPPPKPKKLSSKIAAFQQQLFQPQLNTNSSDSESQDEKSESKNETPKSKPVHFKKFEASGIPLPGMFNPALLKQNQQQSEFKESSSSSSNSTSHNNIKRTRGPKGKKLPKAIANASVESKNPFSWESGKLWSFDFKSTNEDDEEIENCVLANEESKKVANNANPNLNDLSTQPTESVKYDQSPLHIDSNKEINLETELPEDDQTQVSSIEKVATTKDYRKEEEIPKVINSNQGEDDDGDDPKETVNTVVKLNHENLEKDSEELEESLDNRKVENIIDDYKDTLEPEKEVEDLEQLAELDKYTALPKNNEYDASVDE